MLMGACLAFSGFKLRSGHADGSDLCFEVGARLVLAKLRERFPDAGVADGDCLEVYLPWAGFSGGRPEQGNGLLVVENRLADEIAAEYHPAYDRLGDAARQLMGRNSMQVLGPELNEPVQFVMSLTPDGATTGAEVTGKTGGTGQAIRIASGAGIPIYNLARADHLAMANGWIDRFRAKALARLEVDPVLLVDEYLSRHGDHRLVEGDLIKSALRGDVSVIIHGANIHNKMGSGFAKSLKEAFPEAYAADCATRAGDRKKMGTFTSCTVERSGREIRIFNAYVQERYGRDESVLYVDYEAVRKSLGAIAKVLPNASRVGYPKLGHGLANGDWVTLSRTIKNELRAFDHQLFWFPGMEPKMEEVPVECHEPRQSGLGF